MGKIKAKHIIGSVGIALCLGTAVAGSILSNTFFEFIDEGINGSGVKYDENAEKAIAKGDAFINNIMDEGIVMLKNTSGKAPLIDKNNRKVNIFGWSSVDAGFLISGYGSGISRIPDNKRVLLYGGFDKYNDTYPSRKIEYNATLKNFYQSWCNARAVTESLGGNDKLYTNYNPKVDVYTNSSAYDLGGQTLLENAKEFSDNAIIVISRSSGEAQDCPQNYSYVVNTKGGSPTKVNRSYLSLTDEELDLITMVKNNFGNVTILLNVTNMVECGAFDDAKIQNVYYVGVTGQSGARRIPSVLTGDVNPSGRITETCVTDHEESPSYYNFGRPCGSGNSVTYVEDVYVGYKFYETAYEEGYWDGYNSTNTKKTNGKSGYDGIVEYPFGHGLSYTSFSYEIDKSKLSIAEGASFTSNDKLNFAIKVTNTGLYKGKEVVQLYYKPPYTDGGIEKASINLIDFAKTIELKPGESQTLNFEIDPFYMASYDCYDKNQNNFKGYELDKGQYSFCFMKNAHTPLIDGEKDTIKYNLNSNIYFNKDNITGADVKNRLTGEDCVDAVEIDGGQKDLFLSRSDFAGTIKKSLVPAKNVSKGASYIDNFETLPTFNANNGLYLYTDPNGKKITDPNVLHSPTSATVKLNESLVKELGQNYDSPKWDLLLDQLTYSDAQAMVVLGGYSCSEAASIGKIWTRDNDGPMGLTRSNASVLETSKWTWFPMAGLIANSFNKELAYEYGETIANEGNATGVTGWYAPGCNIRRSPFGGRNNEYYSEDPMLSGYIAAETVKGARESGMVVYAKHLALNECETNRSSIATWCSEQTLREIYLRPFELCSKVGKINAYMSAFNRIGGVTARGSTAVLTCIVRNEWGFRGTIVTDWASNAGDAQTGLPAGNDMWLNGSQVNSWNLPSSWYNDVKWANLVRRSCKNIAYSLCNSLSSNKSSKPPVIVDVVRNEPYWLSMVVGLVVLLVDGAALIAYATFFKKPKEEKENN